jgi:prepilin peptidase CpaA
MAFQIALVTLLIGGIWSLGVVLSRRRFAQLMGNLGQILISWRATPQASLSGVGLAASVGTIPYGVAIAAGTLGILFATTFW